MPARIVVVDYDADLLAKVVRGLQQDGFEVVGYSDSAEAYELLRTAEKIEVLVTGVGFRTGTPHGLALAGAARLQRPDLKVVLIARPELAGHVEGGHRLLIRPVSPEQVCAVVKETIGA